MKRKVTFLVILALLITTGVAYAASVNGTFSGLPIVNVKVNGTTLKSDVPGVVLQGRTLLPARAIAESLNSVVTWDQASMTASINKPEVNMLSVGNLEINSSDEIVLTNVGADFFNVGKDNWILMYINIGPMEKQLYTYRIAFLDTNGSVIKVSDSEDAVIDKYGYRTWLQIEGITIPKPGQYKVEFQLKYGDAYLPIEDYIFTAE